MKVETTPDRDHDYWIWRNYFTPKQLKVSIIY